MDAETRAQWAKWRESIEASHLEMANRIACLEGLTKGQATQIEHLQKDHRAVRRAAQAVNTELNR